MIVCLPFANLGSPELRERMNYVKRLEQRQLASASAQAKTGGAKDAGTELYENMCMNAVNQSIGACPSVPSTLAFVLKPVVTAKVAPFGIVMIGPPWCWWIPGTLRHGYEESYPSGSKQELWLPTASDRR